MDFGIHPPTIYFPLVVPEALMIEPTETETKERLDDFVDAMRRIAREAAEEPELLEDRAAHAARARGSTRSPRRRHRSSGTASAIEGLDASRPEPDRSVRLSRSTTRGLGAAASWPHAAAMSRPRVRRTVAGIRARSSDVLERARSPRGTIRRTIPVGLYGIRLTLNAVGSSRSGELARVLRRVVDAREHHVLDEHLPPPQRHVARHSASTSASG